MFSAFINAFKIKEVRDKILFTLGVVALCRVLANIPCPGVDTHALNLYFNQFSQTGGASGMFGMFDMFTGGAIHKFAIATLGVMPYISASIIMQMLQPVIPQFEKMMREGGESGRQKFNQYIRYLTLIICLIQGAMAAYAMQRPQTIGLPSPSQPLVMTSGPSFVLMTMVVLTCGTMLLMWLGERITDNGIGNGASIIITVGILSRMPSAVYSLFELVVSGNVSGITLRPVHLFLLFLLFVLVTAATVVLTQGQRKIPIQYAKKTVGKRMMGGNSFIPLRVNFSGVMPIILAGSILIVPEMLFRWIPATRWIAAYMAYGSPCYMTVYGLLILLFAFFWVANQFNPMQISDNLKRDGAFVPGIRPGLPTAEYLDNTMTRVTLAGSIFLMALALFPMLLNKQLNLPYIIDSFFGGTSLLIMVGVTLDSLSQLESHLISRNYDGFLKNGRITARRNF
jgi:preprotein translocase subunit SecY